MPGNALTVQSILRDKPVTIKSLTVSSPVDLKAAIVKIITDAVLTLAQFKQPTVDQIKFFSDAILSDYNDFSLDDLSLCMLNGLKGKYGVKKNEPDNIISFDSEVLFRWLTKYREEKREISMTSSYSNQFPRDRDRKKPVPMPEDVREILKQKINYQYSKNEDPLKEKIGRQPIDWKKKFPHLTEDEVMIFEYFDETWNEQGNPMKNIPMEPCVILDETRFTRAEFMILAKKKLEEKRNQ